MGEYDAVLLDMDGLLLKVGDQYWRHLIADAVDDALNHYGIDEEHDGYEPLRESMLAMYTHEAQQPDVREEIRGRLEQQTQKYGLDHDELWERKEALAVAVQKNQVQNGERIFYSDVNVLQKLQDHYPIGVVSNNNHAMVDYVLEHDTLAEPVDGCTTLADLIDTAYGIDSKFDDDLHRKPDPHYLRKAADQLDADNALYVGDANQDVQAAHRAGMDSVFVWRPHRRNDDGEKTYTLIEQPTYEIDGLDELLDIVTGETR